MKVTKAHCFFEQSGTFKNEFKKLGIEAEDYDIRNDFGETDNVVDLMKEIAYAYYLDEKTVFDYIHAGEIIFAFFPCTRFEDQIQLAFRGEQYQYKNKDEIFKLERGRKLHLELHNLYNSISMLAIVCLKKNIPLIIENPYSTAHYLTRYWCLKPKVIDIDRSRRGDLFKKPTQYWFINCEPSKKILFEPVEIPGGKIKTIVKTSNKVERSMITSEYARRFIKEFILD